MVVNIRKFVLQTHSLDELVTMSMLTPQAARFLEAAVVAGLNVLVAGGTHVGKTTFTSVRTDVEARCGRAAGRTRCPASAAARGLWPAPFTKLAPVAPPLDHRATS